MDSNELVKARRTYPSYPRIGVGALVRHNDKILLVKRGQEPAKNQWSVPGGLVELGETLTVALEREVFEECSIHIDVLEQLDTFEFIEKDDEQNVKYHYVVLDFLATYKSGTVTAATDVLDARWFSFDEIHELNCTKAIKSLVAKSLNIKDRISQ